MTETTDAVLLKASPYGESDLIVTLFTESVGRVTAFAKCARSSSKRFPVLEPFHTLRVELRPPRREMSVLSSAEVVVPRVGYLSDLARMDVVGRSLSWVTVACPERSPEPALWEALVGYLDRAEGLSGDGLTDEAAAFGLTMLQLLGWAPPRGAVRSGMGGARVLAVVEKVLRESAGAYPSGRSADVFRGGAGGRPHPGRVLGPRSEGEHVGEQTDGGHTSP